MQHTYLYTYLSTTYEHTQYLSTNLPTPSYIFIYPFTYPSASLPTTYLPTNLPTHPPTYVPYYYLPTYLPSTYQPHSLCHTAKDTIFNVLNIHQLNQLHHETDMQKRNGKCRCLRLRRISGHGAEENTKDGTENGKRKFSYLSSHSIKREIKENWT